MDAAFQASIAELDTLPANIVAQRTKAEAAFLVRNESGLYFYGSANVGLLIGAPGGWVKSRREATRLTAADAERIAAFFTVGGQEPRGRNRSAAVISAGARS